MPNIDTRGANRPPRYPGARNMLGRLRAAAAAAPLLLSNGNFYTASCDQPRAQAVVVVDGRITFVGKIPDALRRAPPGARRMDLQGATVLPGLTDAHAHLGGIGERELTFNLEGTKSLAELKNKLRERAAQGKPGAWLYGRGWIESRWTPPVFPTRQDLDAAAADRPVVLKRGDGHALVANSLALKRAGIDRNTPDPPGGTIFKDAAGEPTGLLIDNAMQRVEHLLPPPTDAETAEALEVGARRSVRLGWTQLQIAGNSFHEVEQLCQLYAAGRIQLRLYDAIYGPSADANRLLTEGPDPQHCGGKLPVRAIKLYIDGALGSRGAALLEPYSDSSASRGLLLNTPQSLFPVLTAALRRGIQVETHAIGDRGNRTMLDLYERAFAAVPVDERAVAQPRWRLEHAQILSPADIPRFAHLGVIASMQPSHAISDLFFAPARLGPDRLAGAYAWHSLLDAGAVVAGGTDAPVEKGDPLVEFYAAVARRSLQGFAASDWHLEQRVSRAQALKMLTLSPAYAAFQEQDRGTVEVGKLGDFTVLSADIMTVPEPQILTSHVLLTIIGGEVAYAAPDAPAVR
ncbi:MAG TPA: amidohydrolase [Steroidobacteraceae bacterium]|nr:amidohydrolase [Steroidobacteraceae bacterium]